MFALSASSGSSWLHLEMPQRNLRGASKVPERRLRGARGASWKCLRGALKLPFGGASEVPKTFAR